MGTKNEFFTKECAELLERNAHAVAYRAIPKKMSDGRKDVVLACMDERNTLTEEALGLYPSMVRRIATGGGKIAADDFVRLAGSAAADDGADLSAYLVTHEVIGKPELGCAAFKNDIRAQEKFFSELKTQLAQKMPTALIHVLSMDTSVGTLRAISLDERDEQFVPFARSGGQPRSRCSDEAHAGYGIYVGEAYRAWCSERNTYFHISASAPSLAGDLDIALGVILHHSTVDLSGKPIVLHVDATESWEGLPDVAAERMETAVAAFLAKPEVATMLADGSMRVIRTVTDLKTWRGKVV
jgi:hypothetical protein